MTPAMHGCALKPKPASPAEAGEYPSQACFHGHAPPRLLPFPINSTTRCSASVFNHKTGNPGFRQESFHENYPERGNGDRHHRCTGCRRRTYRHHGRRPEHGRLHQSVSWTVVREGESRHDRSRGRNRSWRCRLAEGSRALRSSVESWRGKVGH